MLTRNELIRLRQALEQKQGKNTLDEELLVKMQKLINQPTYVYEVNGELFTSRKKADREIQEYAKLNIHLKMKEMVVR